MDIKVREVTDVQEKSSQQIQQELLDKHEQQQEVSNQPVEVEEVNNDVQDKELVQEQIKEESEAPPVEESPQYRRYCALSRITILATLYVPILSAIFFITGCIDRLTVPSSTSPILTVPASVRIPSGAKNTRSPAIS